MRILPDIRRDELGGAIAAFLTLFGILASHAILEIAREALFLTHLPVRHLPWLYLAIAAIALPLTRVRSGLLGRMKSHRSLSIMLVASAGVTLVFWLLV